MRLKAVSASIAYRDFLLFASLFLLFGSLCGAAARGALIFPPYMQAPDALSDAKVSALDFFAVSAVAAALCVPLADSRAKRLGRKSAVLLAAWSAVVPTGALALRLDDAYLACNYVPPFIFFALFAAVSAAVRGLRQNTGRKTAGGSAAGRAAASAVLVPSVCRGVGFRRVCRGVRAYAVRGRSRFCIYRYLSVPCRHLRRWRRRRRGPPRRSCAVRCQSVCSALLRPVWIFRGVFVLRRTVVYSTRLRRGIGGV